MEKIALEEHFRVPSMPEYSGAEQYLSDQATAKHIDDLLADFDDLRLQAMDEANVTKAILSHNRPWSWSGHQQEENSGRCKENKRFLG